MRIEGTSMLKHNPNTGHSSPAATLEMSATNVAGFDWPLSYEAETFLRDQMTEFLAQNSFAKGLAQRMQNETGTDFFEWIDHFVLPPDAEHGLRGAGFTPD